MTERYSKVVLTNMCMLEVGDEILVQERFKDDWPGIGFPGGHVETDETLEEAMYREFKEETGLTLLNLKFCGVMEWFFEKDVRYLAMCYKSTAYEGTLRDGEGHNFFIKKKDLFQYKLSQDMDQIFEVMNKD